MVCPDSLGHSPAFCTASPGRSHPAPSAACGWITICWATSLQSWWRIAQAFFWCACIAIPLGVLMASFRWVHHLINPVAAPMRAMPITAFLPAFIALFGMEETMKVAFLWFGMFFYLLAVVVEEAERVDDSLIETAYTLGANRGQVLWLIFGPPSLGSSVRSEFSMTLVGHTLFWPRW